MVLRHAGAPAYHICALTVHRDVAITKGICPEVSAFALCIPLWHLERVCKAHALKLELDGKDYAENGMAYLCACLGAVCT